MSRGASIGFNQAPLTLQASRILLSATPGFASLIRPNSVQMGIRLNGGHYIWPLAAISDGVTSGNIGALQSFVAGLPAYVKGTQLYFDWGVWDMSTSPSKVTSGVNLNTALIDQVGIAHQNAGKRFILCPNLQQFNGTPGSNTSPTTSFTKFPSYLDLPGWQDGSGYAGYQWGPAGVGGETLQISFWRTSTTSGGVSVQSAFINFCNALQIYIAGKSYAQYFELLGMGETSNGLVAQDYTDQTYYQAWANWLIQMRAQASSIAQQYSTTQIGIWPLANYMPTSSNYMTQLLAVAKAQQCCFGGPDNYKDGGIAANELFNGTSTGISSVGTIPWVSKSEYTATAFTFSGPGEGNTATPSNIWQYNWNGADPPHNGAHTEGNLMPHYYCWAGWNPGTAPAGQTYFQYSPATSAGTVLNFLSTSPAVNTTKPSLYP